MGPDVHTPLESLLLFQALHPFEANPPAFGKISDTLKTNELLQESTTSAPNRLEPDSLKNHYLQLLKEEVQTHSERDQGVQIDGLSPLKRKRSIETVDEAFQYKHLLPQLVNRLYFRYRDHAIKSIEEEERRYRSLQREVQEIERGEWDARLGQRSASRRDSRGVSSIQTILRHDGEEDNAQAVSKSRPSSSSAPQNGVRPAVHTDGNVPLPNGIHQTSLSGAPQQTPSGQTYDESSGSMDHNAAFLPPLQPVSQTYTIGSPSSDIHRRLPPPNQVQTHSVPSPSSRSAQTPLPPPERSSASPIILPPPAGMLRSVGSPAGPLDTLADMAGQQYRASPAMPSPRAIQHSTSQQAHQLPQPRNYMHRGYPYYDTQSPYQIPYAPYGQAPPPVGYQNQPSMPSFQGHMATPGHGSPYGTLPPQYQSPAPQYPPQHTGYSRTPGYYQHSPMHPPLSRGHLSQFSEQHTPMSTASGRQRPPRPTPIATSASSTKWKNVDTPGSVRQLSPKSPSPGAISPISEKASSPSPDPPQPRQSGRRGQKGNQDFHDSRSDAARGKATRGRGASRRGRGGRAGSIVSSVHAEPTTGRTRSQSVVSQADELSIDQPGSTPKIKPEPPAPSVIDDDASVASHTADEGSRKLNRQRRGTNRSLETIESSRSVSKRKRESSVVNPPQSLVPTASSKPGYILATRNFPKISAPLMNDITTHKLGNLFAKPLTDREAPGYRDLIYRPQDLRSIRTAINAGGRALIKAAEGLGEEGNSSNVWIPETPEVVPPLGIVNSTQLEKELMRIFANAIMFNPEVPSKRDVGPAFRTRQRTLERRVADEEEEAPSEGEVINGKQDVSVVKDTREIFKAVEEKLAGWKSVERPADEGGGTTKGPGRLRGGGDEEADELAGNEEDIVGSVEQEATPEPRSKRRRR